jgi:cytosol alanyl aminopeptidase
MSAARGKIRLRYEAQLTIDPAQSTFQGRIAIDVELRERLSEVRLNALGLTVFQALWISGGRTSKLTWSDAPGEQLRFPLPAGEGPGRARLEISYSGALSDSLMQGPYRRTQGIKESPKERNDWYVFTTFTPIDARRAFPCFDEPGVKASWQLTLIVPQALVAAANSPVLEEKTGDTGWKTVRFAATAPLPAEVVAFAVGPFDVVPGPPAGEKRIPVRVLAPHGRGADANGAAGATDEVLRRIESYTGTPYPWAKLDHVALPAGTYGAVENPGLITYRSSLLLGAETQDGWRRNMHLLMAHELVHQWFGNLVTQADWDDVYLSEGFATWLGTKVSDEDEPPEHQGVAIVEARNRSLKADEGPQPRPVRLGLRTRTELADVYNAVVYQKAASILRMLEVYLGEQTMQRAMRRYLKAHAGGTANTENLIEALQAESGQGAGLVLAAFLQRAGRPVVTLKLNCTVAGPPSIELQQDLSDPTRPEASVRPWPVPVCVRTASGQSCALLEAAKGTLSLKDQSCPAWFAPNSAGAGYYRARVEGPGVDQTKLTPAERSAWNADK